MTRTCTICSHAERAAIETAVVNGTSYRDIALRFGPSHMAIQRHIQQGHVAATIKESKVAKQEAQGLDVVRQLKAINGVTLAIIEESRKEKKNGMALFAIDRVQKQLELQARLLGDIIDAPQINIYMSPEWLDLRNLIIAALLPFPDARIAVASALARKEREEGEARARLN